MLGSRRRRRARRARGYRISLQTTASSLTSLSPCPIVDLSASLPTTSRCSRCFSPPRSSCGPTATAISICRSTCATAAGRSTPGCGTPARTTTGRSRTATSCVVDGATQLFQGNMQMIANRIRRARPDEVCEADFMTLQTADVERMRGAAGRDPGERSRRRRCSGWSKAFVDDEAFMDKFCRAPAGMKNHHAYKGGLLEHVVSLMELVLRRGAALSAARSATSCWSAPSCTTRRRWTSCRTTATSPTPTRGRCSAT